MTETFDVCVIGHVAREGDGFRYFPQPLQMQL